MIPAKIVLKSTTSKTLNDRFTEMARKQVRSPPQVTITGVRGNQFQVAQASIKNRRLAAQMANRPNIKEVLGGDNSSNLKSRLGSPGSGRGGVKKGLLKNRLGTGSPVAAKNRGGFGGRLKQSRGQGIVRGVVKRGGIRGNIGVGRSGRGLQRAKRGARGGRVGRVATRGRGRGDKPVSKDKLDAELDQYMSKTKSHLDAELDEYMQHADDE